MEQYLSTGTDRGAVDMLPQVGALVKCARMYGPWPLLSHGLVLVDLPGWKDADAGERSDPSADLGTHNVQIFLPCSASSRVYRETRDDTSLRF